MSAAGRPLGVGLLLAAAALAAALVACNLETSTGPIGAGVNTPSVGVTTQGLGFAVQARDFTFQQVYSAPAEGDSLGVGLSVAGYGGGTVLLEIVDHAGTAILSQQVAHNIAQGQNTVGGTPPYRVRLEFAHFTGAFALGIGPVAH
jgi:hypothetical protein